MGTLKTTKQHIRRAPYQALAAVMIMTLTLFVASLFMMMALTSQKILSYLETKPQVTAFFKEGTSTQQVEALKQKLQATGKIASLKYVSQEEALAIYREQNKNDPLLLEMVTANILPASLEVSAVEASYLSEISEILKKEPTVEEVVFQKDIVETVISWTRAARYGGAILVSFLSVISFFIILAVIGIKIAAKKEEIEIMKLVGASHWYIRWPFILEGAFYGTVGALLAWGVSYLLLLYATPILSSFLQGLAVFPVSPIFMLGLLLALVLGGVLVGSLGSLLAVWRYLRT